MTWRALFNSPYAAAMSGAQHLIMCAEVGASQALLAENLLKDAGAGFKRAVMLSRVVGRCWSKPG